MARWPWVKRSELEDEKVASSLLRHQIRLRDRVIEDQRETIRSLRAQLVSQNLRAVDAMDAGFRMGAGLGPREVLVAPDNMSAQEYLRTHGEPLGGG